MDPPAKSLLSRLGHWAAELLLIFLGAYAAFWLTNYQQHRADNRRHDQILAWLEERMSEGLEATKQEAIEHDQLAAKFRSDLAAGKMPPLAPFSFTADYSASDTASVLQAGGYEVLEIKTLSALRESESTIRQGLERMTHYQKLSDELIWPNLDQDISFFYDPASKKLRKRFADYPEVLEDTAKFFHDLEKAKRHLLAQIQAERQKR
ncbi:MAG TPA: hypothetical protein VLK27_00200 [Chthoniobacterales bacterium]|nr:hypothetical protein [Chthoniobacterales bacterium]